MNQDFTVVPNRYSAELQCSVLDLLKESGIAEKVCAKVKQLILYKRDSTLFRVSKFGAQDYGRLYKNIR